MNCEYILIGKCSCFKGAINESGLGVLSWWDQQVKEEEQEGEDGEDNTEYDNDEDGEGACEE